MEQRHTEIREGAGLEESRINQEFVDWLRQWGPYILFGFAIIAAAYAGLRYLEDMRVAARDQAFVDLNNLTVSADPSGLVQVAEEHESIAAVPHLARLQAADIYLDCARLGITPAARAEYRTGGAWDGGVKEEDAMDPSVALDKAQAMYQAVVEETSGKQRFATVHVGALFGLAAVEESRGRLDEARSFYEQAERAAEKAGDVFHVEQSRSRRESIDGLAMLTLGDLPTGDSLPASGAAGTTPPNLPPVVPEEELIGPPAPPEEDGSAAAAAPAGESAPQ